MRAPPAAVRHLLPGVGVLPRTLSQDSVSGLVGSALGFARASASAAKRVELWGLADPAPAFDRYALDGVQLRGIRPWRLGRVGPLDLRYQMAAGAAAMAGAPCTLLHVHALPTLLLLPKARRRVLHLHMALGQASPLEVRLLRRADAVVCASEYLAASFAAHHPQYRGVVRVIRNGADPERYADAERGTALRRRLGLRADDRVVVFAGQVAPEKGIDRLIAALALLPLAQRPHLVIAGSGTLWHSFKSVGSGALSAFEREMRERTACLPVHWLGKVAVDDMPGVLLAADVVCCPSVVQEGLATINLEAAAAGKPGIASRVGGVPEIVDDGNTGILVPPDDTAALARALTLLLGDTDLRRRMGAAARRRVHTWDQAAIEMAAVYDEVAR